MHLSMLLDMAADGFGDRVVVGPRAGGLTPAALKQVARGGAALVREAGADAIVYLAVNGPAFPAALFAAAHAGVPLVPVNYRLGAEQLDGILAGHPRALVIADAGSRVAGRTPEQFLADAAQPQEMSSVVVDDAGPAVVIYTSGTTSAPKGVLLRDANLVSYVFGTVEFGSAEADEAALMSVPPYHIAAVSNVLTNLFAGRRVVTLPTFDAGEWLATVRAEQITNAMVVPTMLARIMACPDDLSVPSLRSLAYGGAAMPPQVIDTALRAWPHVDFVNAYGLTETSSTVAVLGPEEHRAAIGSDDPDVRARLHSAGRPVPGVDLEIRDDAGAVVPAGTLGRIWIRGEQVSGEYAGSGPAVDAAGSSTPATPAASTPRATCSCWAGSTTRSSAAERTSPRPRSRMSCCATPTWPTPPWSAFPTPSGASDWRRSSSRPRARTRTPRSCALTYGPPCVVPRPRTGSSSAPSCPAPRPASCSAETSSPAFRRFDARPAAGSAPRPPAGGSSRSR